MEDLKILLVDDDPVNMRLISALIKKMGFKADECLSGKEALSILCEKKKHYDIVFLDWVMPKISGVDVLKEAKPVCLQTSFIVLTANSSINNAVEAMQNGACDFLTKPVSSERLQSAIDNALRVTKLQREVSRLQAQVKINRPVAFDNMIAQSPEMKKVLKLASRAAPSNIPILIDGESGTGKEVMARAIRAASHQKEGPFVTVNCGAIASNLVESTLFGHEKGSFTGATHKYLGKFQEAHGGTIFLDEIGELPLDMQVKLLRVLQEGEVDPVGSKNSVKVNVRILSATNRDLFEMVQKGEFREDLFYRLNVFQLTLPPLNQRKEDLQALIAFFTKKFALEENKKIEGIEGKALKMLTAYMWPGNIRQLENIIFRAVVLSDHKKLMMEDFPPHIVQPTSRKKAS